LERVCGKISNNAADKEHIVNERALNQMYKHSKIAEKNERLPKLKVF